MDKAEEKAVVQVGTKAHLFQPGPDSRRNVTKPGTGRPPDAWKAECRELASRDEMLAKARTVLDQPDHPAWLGAWRFVAEQGYGKAPQTIQGPDGGPIQVQVVNAATFRPIAAPEGSEP